MNLSEILKEKEITQYFLAKKSGVPYSTINEICNGKTTLKNCKSETLYKISKTIKISMEELIEMDERVDFDSFKSKKFIKTDIKNDDYNNECIVRKNKENTTKATLVEFENNYPNVINENNIQDILNNLT